VHIKGTRRRYYTDHSDGRPQHSPIEQQSPRIYQKRHPSQRAGNYYRVGERNPRQRATYRQTNKNKGNNSNGNGGNEYVKQVNFTIETLSRELDKIKYKMKYLMEQGDPWSHHEMQY
jgi:hypothetical protein